jgi:hypothetical protein
VRDLTFYDENYYLEHPEIPVSKKEDSPDEDKSLADAKALLLTLRDFHGKHPLINFLVVLHLIASISAKGCLGKMVLDIPRHLSRSNPGVI